MVQKQAVATKGAAPELRGAPLLGHTLGFFRDPLSTLQAVAALGDVATFRLGTERLWLVNHPGDIEQVFVTDWEAFHRDRFTRRIVEPLNGPTLASIDGPEWERQRRLAQPAFLPERLRRCVPAMAEEARFLCSAWTPGAARNVRADLERSAFRVGASVVFGEETPRVVEQLERGHDRLIRWYLRRGGRRDPPRWVARRHRAFRRAVDEFHGVADQLAARRRLSSGSGEGVFGRFVHPRDGGPAYDAGMLRNFAVMFPLAASLTTATSIASALCLLAEHPEAQERAAAEAQAVLDGAALTAEDLPRLPYCEAVAKEALRLYPPTWVIGREAQADVDLGGYRVRRGTTLLVSPYLVHRDARWFTDPEAFRPERWLGEGPSLPKFAYFPFGGGPHLCLGQLLAKLEQQVVLATVLQRLRVSFPAGERLEPGVRGLLHPRSSVLQFASR